MKYSLALLAGLPLVFGQTKCGQYDTIPVNNYVIGNNLWGEGSANPGGYGCITLDSASTNAWHADWRWQGNNNQVKSYPNIGLNLGNKRIVGQIGSMPTSVSWSYSGSGQSADVAYDLFTASNPNHATYYGDYELMIWLGKYGPIGPIGSYQTNVNIGGVNFNLYYGYNGAMQVYSFIATGTQQNFNGDVKNFYNWLASNRGYPINSQYLLSYQFGTEPFVGNGNTLSVSRYSAAVN